MSTFPQHAQCSCHIVNDLNDELYDCSSLPQLQHQNYYSHNHTGYYNNKKHLQPIPNHEGIYNDSNSTSSSDNDNDTCGCDCHEQKKDKKKKKRKNLFMNQHMPFVNLTHGSNGQYFSNYYAQNPYTAYPQNFVNTNMPYSQPYVYYNTSINTQPHYGLPITSMPISNGLGYFY